MKKFTKILFALAFLLFGVNAMNAQTPFWSEDFDSQLPSDWTAAMVAGNGTPSSNWIWTNTGPAGGFSIGALASTSAANGWMIFDSDLNCSGNQDVRLITPKLNTTGKNTVTLQFETHYRRFNDETSIMVSTDSVTWTEVPVFDGHMNNDFADGTAIPDDAINPYVTVVDLTASAANKPQVWIAFRFLSDATTVQAGDPGCGYSWQIDDVALFDTDLTPAINIAIGDFFYPPASYAQPISQIKDDTMGFFADLSNLGSASVTNIILKAEVRQASNTIWSDSILIPSLDTGVVDSTFELLNQFVPDQLAIANNYSIRYSVYSQDGDDSDLADNSRSENFEVTDFVYSKESGATTAYRPGGDPTDWAIANVYRTSKNWVDQYKATSATMRAVKNASDGNFNGNQVAIALTMVNDDLVDAGWNGFDDAGDYINNTTMFIKSINLYDFTQTTTDVTLTQELIDFDNETPGVILEPGKRYVLIADYKGAGNNAIFHGFSENISYFQISTLVFTDQWYLGGFGPEPAAVLRMNIDLYNTTDEVSLPDNSLNFFPNPANQNLNVDINLEEPTLANITLADINGRVIQIDEVENAFKQSRQYDVSNLPNGTYIVRIATKFGTKTKKFVVQH